MRQGRYRGGQNRRLICDTAPSPDKSARSDAGGGGPKPAPAIPSSTDACDEEIVVIWNMPKPQDSGSLYSLLTAPVELATTRKVPVEPAVKKWKAQSPLEPRQQPRRSDPSSPTSWELARTKVKVRFKYYITPPLEDMADLPVEPPSRWWQVTAAPKGNGARAEREREMFYLTTHSTHFIYGYMASDIWLRTILIVRKETRCRHIGYSYRITARVLLYAPSPQTG